MRNISYVTERALLWLISILPNNCKVALVARLKPFDFVNKSSDLAAIELALNNNWEVFRLSELHAKIYLINGTKLFVGSANCTSNGLKLYGVGNIETFVELEATDEDRSFIQTIIDQSDVVDFGILQQMKEHISSMKSNDLQGSYKDWSSEIFAKSYSIWVSDLFWDSPEKLKANEHDMDILNINPLSNSKEISGAFVETKIFRWLYALLKSIDTGEIYFGSLSEKLHNQLCDSPLPYRKDIKQLLAILLAYCDIYATHLVKVERPRYSQRVSLVNEF